MFCVNCGQEIADGAKFCPKCGAVQEQASQPSYSAPQQDYNSCSNPRQTYGAPASAPNNQKKTPMGLIIGIIAAVVVVIALIIVFVVVKPGSKANTAEEDPAQPEQTEQTDIAPEAEPEEAPAEEVPSGHYILTEVTEDGEVYGTDLIAWFGGESYLDLNDDSTFYLYFIAEDSYAEGTWTGNTLTSEGEDFAFDYDPDAMTVSISDEESGVVLTFTHESVAPVIEYIIADDGDDEWVESDDGEYFLYNFEIPETVVYDEGGITVTLTGIEDDGWYGYEIQYTIINGSDKNITVSSDYTAINGCVFGDSMYTDVAAGKNASDCISVGYDDLEDAGLTQFFELALQVDVEDDDTWDDIGTSGLVHVFVDEETMKNGYEADALPAGDLVFDSNGIQLYFVDVENDGWDDGDGYAIFVLVNNSGHDLWSYSDNTAYNGWMVSDSFYATIPDGCWKLVKMYVTDYENASLESYEGISEIEFTFVCKDNNDWSSICDDADISLSVSPIPR